MSGFVCIFHRDGAPVDQALLQRLTDFLEFRGPDARGLWSDISVGMGHALLRTTIESESEQQPAALDGRYWITADARLDAREELIGELRRAEQPVRMDAPDCELILKGYAAWGAACVEHFHGDFSFAIWDATGKQLFCARDHFGIKPFYFAQCQETFLCSNTLNCLRLHPFVSDGLNEAAVGDFVLFGLNYDNGTTTFRDIQRLPPAHVLAVSASGAQSQLYWAPPTSGRIRYSHPSEYVENFLSIFEKAVADRLRSSPIAISLSGGLDSSSVAAVAADAARRSVPKTELRAYTFVYESLIPDCDGEFARDVADLLRIPVKFMAMDDVQLFARCEDPSLGMPEPVDNPFQSAILDSFRDISADCRVLLSGEGSDNLMDFEMWPYARDLVLRGEWRRLFTEAGNYLGMRPFPWRGLRARTLQLMHQDPDEPVFPAWLAPEFSRRANLPARWKEQLDLPKSWRAHPIHPRGHGSLALPQWTHMFEMEDPGATRYPVETRYPFLDLRVVNFLLALPPFPWFYRKTLLREAMSGRLPERVRTRAKTPQQADPVVAQIRRNGAELWKKIPLSGEGDRYIDRSALVAPPAEMNAEQASVHVRPYCFNVWLHSARRDFR